MNSITLYVILNNSVNLPRFFFATAIYTPNKYKTKTLTGGLYKVTAL